MHRFDRQLNGSYKPVMTFGNTKAKNDVNPAGNVCNDQTRLAAPYDLTMSLGGELIVINTTCYFPTKNGDIPAGSVEIVRFGQDGSSRGLIHAKAVVANRAHGIVIDAANVLHVSQAGIKIPLTKVSGGAIQVDNQVFDPTWSDVGADAKGGGPLGIAAPVVAPIDPDTQAPVISSVVATQIGYSTAVSLSITATDNRGIVDVRTGEDGKAFDWRGSYQSSITEEIGFYGQKWVALQVSDAAGNYTEWFWVLAKVKEEPPAPIVVPTPVPTPAPVVTPTQAVTPTPVPAPNLSVDKAPISSSNPSSANVSKPLAPLAPPSEANLSATSPVINKVVLPPSLKTRKARIKVNAFSSSKEKLFIRFANENGKWSKLKPISTSQVMLSQGAGWKGVFVQVVDAKGNRSRIWFQTLLLGSANSSWIRGTAGADNIQGTAKDDYIDLTRFDGKKDTVRCGAGYDTVLLQPEDKAASDCEKVVYLRTPSF